MGDIRHGRRVLLAGSLVGILVVGVPPEGRAQQPAPGAGVAAAQPRVYDLKAAVATALQNHPALAAAQARSQAVKTGIAVEQTRYQPYVDASVATGKTLAGDRELAFRDGIEVATVTTDPFYSSSLRLTVPLLREGRLVFMSLPSEDVARARHDSTRYREQLTRSEVVRNATVAFVAVLAAKEEVRLAEEGVGLNRRLVEGTQLRFEQRVIPQVDLLAAQSGLASAEADLAAARVNLATSLDNFAAALGLPSAAIPGLDVVDTDASVPAPPAFEQMVRDVTTRHPAVLAQEAVLKEARATLEQLKTERYPTVDGRATIGTVDDYSLPQDFWSFRAVIRLNWRIFDFGSLGAQIKQQEEVVEAEQRALEQSRNQAITPVIAAYRNFANTQARLAAARKAVELADEQVRVAQERFQQALAPQSDVLRSEANRTAARKTLTQAQYAARIEQAVLAAAVATE